MTPLRFFGLWLLVWVSGCAKQADRFTLDRVTQRGMTVPDVDKVCSLGSALYHVLGATGNKKSSHKALIIADATAALCVQQEAWEAELAALRAKHNWGALGAERANEIRDARLVEQRYHQETALRFFGAVQHLDAAFGRVGEGCPAIAPRDEIAYLVGVIAGTLAQLHDKAGGNFVGVPMDTLPRMARAAECLDNEKWWNVPSTIQWSAWVSIPGSGPADVEPWAALESAASQGESSGVRVARAMASLIASNADQTEALHDGIVSHAKSLENTPSDPKWALLDAYATSVTLFASDRVWTAEQGHRTPEFGVLPGWLERSGALGRDPFAAYPFGPADPFGEIPTSEDSSPDESPSVSPTVEAEGD